MEGFCLGVSSPVGGGEADPLPVDLQGGLGVGELLDDLAVPEADDVDAAPGLEEAPVGGFGGGPVEAPAGGGLLAGLVDDGVLGGEAEAAVVPEPGGPRRPEGLDALHGAAGPVLEADFVVEEGGDGVEVVGVEGLVHLGEDVLDLVPGEHCRRVDVVSGG